MKEDKLEEYIRNNRAQFDDSEPSDEVWGKISGNLERNSGKRISWVRIAMQTAAAVLIFFSAWYVKDILNSSHPSMSMAMRKNIQLHPVVKTTNNDKVSEPQQPDKYNFIALNNNGIERTQKEDSIPEEIIEATQYYANQISQTRNLIMNCENYNTEIDQQVNVEFAELDDDYKSLYNDLRDNMDNSEVLEAMIQNYRTRLEILESIMQQFEATADCYEKKKN